VVIAGPNGAGKSSSAPRLLRDTVGVGAFVNADVIAQGLAGFAPEDVALEAGRIMLQRLDELIGAGSDFAFETTLSGRTVKRLIDRAVAVGYEVHFPSRGNRCNVPSVRRND
jgi:predicted ABC-type ATPase